MSKRIELKEVNGEKATIVVEKNLARWLLSTISNIALIESKEAEDEIIRAMWDEISNDAWVARYEFDKKR